MARVVVLHAYYGCDTGCCGHVVEMDGVEVSRSFSFSHPYSRHDTPSPERDADYKKYAEDLIREKLGEEHVKDLDFENSQVYDD